MVCFSFSLLARTALRRLQGYKKYIPYFMYIHAYVLLYVLLYDIVLPYFHSLLRQAQDCVRLEVAILCEAYRETLKQKFARMPEIARIKRHRPELNSALGVGKMHLLRRSCAPQVEPETGMCPRWLQTQFSGALLEHSLLSL